ncbi:MAG: hypothetical protein RIA69_10470 [Cyclobacteriaceae bacterium]
MKKSKTIIIGIMVAILAFASNTSDAQNTKPVRKGFTIGGSAGIGVLHFTKGMTANETSGDISLPNMKIGWFVKDNLAVYLNTAGQIYETDGLDRSFEGIIPSIQYWTSDKWWVSGGFGAALDTRAFYESNSKSAKNEWGKGVLLASGYEFKQKEKWAMDLQARLFMASVSRDDLENLEGTNFTIAFGFTLF